MTTEEQATHAEVVAIAETSDGRGQGRAERTARVKAAAIARAKRVEGRLAKWRVGRYAARSRKAA